jgi:hypothetical protein
LAGGRASEWKRLQEHRIHHAEDCRRRADTQREREYRDRCEYGTLAQDALAVAQILQQRLDHRDAAPVAIGLLYLLHSAETALRFLASLIGRHPPAQVLLNQRVDVEAKLIVQFAIQPSLSKDS